MYERELRVMPSDVSCNGTIKLRNLLNYFQDTAGLAVEDIEGTAAELFSRGYAWVLSRYEIDFAGKLPALDETFTIMTYHDPNHGYNTLRCFRVKASDGRDIITAKTSWLLVDTKAGRPTKPAAHIPGLAQSNTQAIPSDFTDIPAFDDTEIAKTIDFPVMFHDLDYNSHVNNAAYFEWVYDGSPVDVMENELAKMCASFRSGARLGENVRLQFSLKDEVSLCRVLRQGVKKPCAEFMCVWRKKERE